MNERWKNVSVELRCIQSLLEEVITYWKKFIELTQQFDAWLDRALAMVSHPEEDKMDYFQVSILCKIVKKINIQNDSLTCNSYRSVIVNDLSGNINYWNLSYIRNGM